MRRTTILVLAFLLGYLIGGAIVNIGHAAEGLTPPPTYPAVTPDQLKPYLALPKYPRPQCALGLAIT